MRIREARIEDVDAVTQIYNDAVLNTVATFDTQPKTISDQERWFTEHDSKNPILVAEEDGLVLGWASLSRWSDRCGYCDTSEISVYVRTGYRGKGIGRSLVERGLEAAEEAFCTIRHTKVELPVKARIFKSVTCAFCGEPVSESRARIREGQISCIPCAGEYTRGW